MDKNVLNAVRTAVDEALREVGLQNFKKTSFFMSNTRRLDEDKLAA